MPRFRELLPVASYDYARLDAKVAGLARALAQRILPGGDKSLADVIAIGNDLIALKQLMGFGEFDRWRRAVFQSRESTAERAMAVARWLGSKSGTMPDLPIRITAAYRLVRRSVPEVARAQTLEFAAAGKEITSAVADEFIAAACGDSLAHFNSLPDARLYRRAFAFFEFCRKQAGSKRLRRYAQSSFHRLGAIILAEQKSKGKRL